MSFVFTSTLLSSILTLCQNTSWYFKPCHVYSREQIWMPVYKSVKKPLEVINVVLSMQGHKTEDRSWLKCLFAYVNQTTQIPNQTKQTLKASEGEQSFTCSAAEQL